MSLPANRHKWPFISHLTIWDFACLTFDIEPEHGDLYQSLPTEFIPVSWRRAQFEIRSDVLHLFPDKFKDRLEMLLAHFDTKEGRFLYLSPLDGSSIYAHSSVLREVPRADADAFAKHCQWPIPKDLEYRAPTKPPAPEVTLTAVPTPSPEDAVSIGDWVYKAQTRAREIIMRQRKLDLYPHQRAIADEIAKVFRGAGIFGVDGKPLSGAYIKRHALKGISSAQGKQQSTLIRRGK